MFILTNHVRILMRTAWVSDEPPKSRMNRFSEASPPSARVHPDRVCPRTNLSLDDSPEWKARNRIGLCTIACAPKSRTDPQVRSART